MTPEQNPFNGRPLWRFFGEVAHADALARGEVWLSTFARCRVYEDSEQGDAGEGAREYPTGGSYGGPWQQRPPLRTIARRAGIGVGVPQPM